MVAPGESREGGERAGQGSQRQPVGVHQGTEQAGGGGFARARRSVQHQRRIGAGGAEGGEEPQQAADPGPVIGEVQQAAELMENGGGVRGWFGRRQGLLVEISAEVDAVLTGNLVGFGSDADGFALGAAVEVNSGRAAGIAVAVNAERAVDGFIDAEGEGGDGSDGFGEGGARRGLMADLVVLAEEPGAADFGVDGDRLVAVSKGERVVDDGFVAAEADHLGGNADQRFHRVGIGSSRHRPAPRNSMARGTYRLAGRRCAFVLLELQRATRCDALSVYQRV